MKNSNQPIKRSFLMNMIIALTAVFHNSPSSTSKDNRGGSSFGDPIFSPKRGKFKGYMRNLGMSSRERKNWKN